MPMTDNTRTQFEARQTAVKTGLQQACNLDRLANGDYQDPRVQRDWLDWRAARQVNIVLPDEVEYDVENDTDEVINQGIGSNEMRDLVITALTEQGYKVAG
jgi:hypothetical protein